MRWTLVLLLAAALLPACASTGSSGDSSTVKISGVPSNSSTAEARSELDKIAQGTPSTHRLLGEPLQELSDHISDCGDGMAITFDDLTQYFRENTQRFVNFFY